MTNKRFFISFVLRKFYLYTALKGQPRTHWQTPCRIQALITYNPLPQQLFRTPLSVSQLCNPLEFSPKILLPLLLNEKLLSNLRSIHSRLYTPHPATRLSSSRYIAQNTLRTTIE